jgi:hypothetical protein
MTKLMASNGLSSLIQRRTAQALPRFRPNCRIGAIVIRAAGICPPFEDQKTTYVSLCRRAQEQYAKGVRDLLLGLQFR